MRVLRAASFDLYGRYSHLWNLRRDAFGPEALRILDVGDPFGTIAPLLPDDHTVSLDLYVDGAPTGRGHQHVLGSGFELPFPDEQFDLVCSHDTFEHLPAERRPDFVDELLRVSRGPVVLVAPFDDDRTRLCESIVNGYFVARLGHSIPALDEHELFGLPSLDGSLVAARRAWRRVRGARRRLALPLGRVLSAESALHRGQRAVRGGRARRRLQRAPGRARPGCAPLPQVRGAAAARRPGRARRPAGRCRGPAGPPRRSRPSRRARPGVHRRAGAGRGPQVPRLAAARVDGGAGIAPRPARRAGRFARARVRGHGRACRRAVRRPRRVACVADRRSRAREPRRGAAPARLPRLARRARLPARAPRGARRRQRLDRRLAGAAGALPVGARAPAGQQPGLCAGCERRRALRHGRLHRAAQQRHARRARLVDRARARLRPRSRRGLRRCPDPVVGRRAPRLRRGIAELLRHGLPGRLQPPAGDGTRARRVRHPLRMRRLDARVARRVPEQRRVRRRLLRLLRGRRLRLAPLGARLPRVPGCGRALLPPHARDVVAVPGAPARPPVRAQRAALDDQEPRGRRSRAPVGARAAAARQARRRPRRSRPRALRHRRRHRHRRGRSPGRARPPARRRRRGRQPRLAPRRARADRARPPAGQPRDLRAVRPALPTGRHHPDYLAAQHNAVAGFHLREMFPAGARRARWSCPTTPSPTR